MNILDEITRSDVLNEVIDPINHEFPMTVLQGKLRLLYASITAGQVSSRKPSLRKISLATF